MIKRAAITIAIVLFLFGPAIYGVIEMNQVRFKGVITPSEHYSLSLRFPIVIDSLYIKESEPVCKGDTLLRFKMIDLKTEKARLMSIILDFEQKIKTCELDSRLLKKKYETSTQSTELLASLVNVRKKSVANGLSSPLDYAEWDKEYVEKKAGTDELSERLRLLSNGNHELASLQSQRDYYLYQLQAIENNCTDQDIIDSFIIFNKFEKGYIEQLNVVNKQMVEPGKTIILAANIQKLYIVGALDQNDISRVKNGMPVQFKLPFNRFSLVHHRYSGKISSFSSHAVKNPDALNQEVKIPIIIIPDSLPHIVIPNMTVEMNLL